MKVIEDIKPIISTEGQYLPGREFLWMTWSGVISIANSVLLWIFLARMRDVDELGRFTILMGLYALFVSACSLGLVPYLVSEVSRRRERSDSSVGLLISNASLFLFASGVVSAVLMALCGLWASESQSVRYSALILSLAMIPSGLIALAEAVSIAYGRTRLIAVSTTLENVLRTVIPLGLIWYGYDLSAVCVSFVAVRVVALAIYAIAARSQLNKFVFDTAELRAIVKATPTFAGTIIFASINWQAAVILLGHFSTEAESAKYGAASRFLIPAAILMASYAAVIQPLLAQYAVRGLREMGSYLSQIVRYPLFVAVIASVLSPFLSERVLAILFGAAYADASLTLDIMALSTIPFCLVMIVARGLVAADAQHIDLLANALGLIVCIAAGAMLIPQFGAVGAAVAQLLSFLLMAVVEIAYLSRKVAGSTVASRPRYSNAIFDRTT